MIKYDDVSVAFSPDGDTLSWRYSKDALIVLQLGKAPVYTYMQGRMYVKGSQMTSYKNSWPISILPPKHRYLCSSLQRFYEDNYEVHPNAECQSFCPRCYDRRKNREITLSLINRQTVPRIVYIPHFLKGRTVSPHI